MGTFTGIEPAIDAVGAGVGTAGEIASLAALATGRRRWIDLRSSPEALDLAPTKPLMRQRIRGNSQM
jgi:hypothetical protein